MVLYNCFLEITCTCIVARWLAHKLGSSFCFNKQITEWLWMCVQEVGHAYPDRAANQHCHSHCVSSCWPRHLVSLRPALLKKRCQISAFLIRCCLSFRAGCQNIIMVRQEWLQNNRMHYFWGEVTLSDSRMCHLSLPSVWFYLHVVYQIWQKHTAAGPCCGFSGWDYVCAPNCILPLKSTRVKHPT